MASLIYSNTGGGIDLAGPFFQNLGTNGAPGISLGSFQLKPNSNEFSDGHFATSDWRLLLRHGKFVAHRSERIWSRLESIDICSRSQLPPLADGLAQLRRHGYGLFRAGAPSLSGLSIYVGSGRFGTDSTRTVPVSTTAASAHNPAVNDPVRVFR